MTNSWDPGFIAAPNTQRYQAFTVFPLTAEQPPAVKKIRTGPSTYRYVNQSPQYEGQITVVLPGQSNVPTMMCVVRINGTLVWKQVLFGQVNSLTRSGPLDPFRKQRKPNNRKRKV